MTQLLSIEQNFLNSTAVKNALNLTEIRKLQRTLTNAQKSKFTNTLSLSKLVVKAHDWFVSEEGKALLTEQGLSWTKEEFGLKVFGWQKSYLYKVLKAGNLEQQVVDLFNEKCDEAEAEGQEPNRTLEGLLKFAKAAAQAQAAGGGEGGGEGEGEGEGEGSEPAVEVRTATVLTLSFKASELNVGRNVAVRIDVNGVVTTNNTAEEVTLAIQFLQEALNQNNQ